MFSPCFSTGVGSSTAPGYLGNLTLLARVQLSSSSFNPSRRVLQLSNTTAAASGFVGRVCTSQTWEV